MSPGQDADSRAGRESRISRATAAVFYPYSSGRRAYDDAEPLSLSPKNLHWVAVGKPPPRGLGEGWKRRLLLFVCAIAVTVPAHTHCVLQMTLSEFDNWRFSAGRGGKGGKGEPAIYGAHTQPPRAYITNKLVQTRKKKRRPRRRGVSRSKLKKGNIKGPQEVLKLHKFFLAENFLPSSLTAYEGQLFHPANVSLLLLCCCARRGGD